MRTFYSCIIAAIAPIFAGTVGYGATPEIVIQPTTAFTARLIVTNTGPTLGLVGQHNDEGTAWKSTFLDAKEGTSDRVIDEFDLRNQPLVSSAYYQFSAFPSNTPASDTTLQLYAFSGNGLANQADYFRLDQFVTNFDGAGSNSTKLSWSLDVTSVYNSFVSNHQDFLGLLFKTGANARYSFLLYPELHVTAAPEPASFILFVTAAVCFVGRTARK
jgi:hypothetical protein